MELKDRERSVDIKKLNVKDAEVLAGQIGDKVREIVDECIGKVDQILKIYGLEAQMQIVIQEDGVKSNKTKKKPKAPRKDRQS